MSAHYLCLTLLSILFIVPSSSSSSSSSLCPIDFTYVQTIPWDTTSCNRQNAAAPCCQTLLSLFGIGLAQHLKDTSLFHLPNFKSSSSCLTSFQSKLSSISLPSSLVPNCFLNPSQFAANSSNCAGILSTHDWVARVGSTTPVDTACGGDLTGLTHCGTCVDAGMKLTSRLMGLDPNGTKCFYFTVLYAAGIANEFGPKDTRVASCIMGLPLKASKMNRASLLSRNALMAVGFGFTFLVVVAVLVLRSKKKWFKEQEQEQKLRHFGAKWFSITELEKATNGFSQRNLIGQGADGFVYKGKISDGSLVAVKQIIDLDSKRDEDFTNEVEIISKMKHRNLLSLRGCCIENYSKFKPQKRKFLVYDFMPNGNLSDHLFIKNNNKNPLTWPQRKAIILDIARGLNYLHYGTKPAIYHRDIKPTNILLDSEWRARLADFGLAKQSKEGQSHLTTRVAGTRGYLAPEYGLYGQLTEKSDVYSFGIVILEMMSGRKVLESWDLITDWAWKLVGNVEAIFEESIRGEGAKGVMERFVHVGLLCAHVNVAFRPTIDEALKMLEGDIEIPQLPNRPLPLSHHSMVSLQFAPPSSSSHHFIV
ncbi:probable receptor-like protein kinase At1g11050 [Cucurbita pepo subsp. pepo]|uniref:probable receptor-like protein kinase At1g11050 n=1 Tax=Cucurbita pepo subsp. pepo TaxID=3664 RepID=UPI000C9D731A|nr:probable receptor-like protein kinase At1g11050 [Cucurbita pepo subsp. pepo]